MDLVTSVANPDSPCHESGSYAKSCIEVENGGRQHRVGGLEGEAPLKVIVPALGRVLDEGMPLVKNKRICVPLLEMADTTQSQIALRVERRLVKVL